MNLIEEIDDTHECNNDPQCFRLGIDQPSAQGDDGPLSCIGAFQLLAYPGSSCLDVIPNLFHVSFIYGFFYLLLH